MSPDGPKGPSGSADPSAPLGPWSPGRRRPRGGHARPARWTWTPSAPAGPLYAVPACPAEHRQEYGVPGVVHQKPVGFKLWKGRHDVVCVVQGMGGIWRRLGIGDREPGVPDGPPGIRI
ncbi:hypothetical protein 43L [Ranavirus ambystoma1]|uniref:Uncharacterized protein n=1 Tax=Ranavirus ambystoma1 TaxID=265294 RepID=A0A4Y5T840_9VIRU|nr:hypothetical protein 43L [Ambystoma tigrinum virus]